MTPQRNHTGPLFIVFLILFIGCTLALLGAGEDFFTFAADTIKASAQAEPLSKQNALKLSRPADMKLETGIKYRKFSITAPKAKKVELLADINGWGKYPIELKGNEKGYFETTLVLSAGEYKYTFLVDGKETLDPLNKDRRTINGREVCVKQVK